MTIDTKRLRELAEKATPGPWAHYGTEPFEVYDSKEYSNGEPGPYVAKWVRDYDDAAYIAATDPQTVLALLDEIDRYRGTLARILGYTRGAVRRLMPEELAELERERRSDD